MARTTAFIDAGQFRVPIVEQRLQIGPDHRFDWNLFKRVLDEIASGDGCNDIHYFDAKSEQLSDGRNGFHQVLKNHLGFQLHFTHLKERHRRCPQCKCEYVEHEQKGVDVAMTTSMLTLAVNRGFDHAILCSGDGDFANVIRFMRDNYGLRVTIVGWAVSISPTLKDVANQTINLDDYADRLVSLCRRDEG